MHFGPGGDHPLSPGPSWAQSNAQTDLAEITIGQIAQARASYPATRALAARTMSDHVAALAQLQHVAAQVGASLPSTPNADQQATAAKLRSVASSAFDATYDQAQVTGHNQSIAGTNAEVAAGTNSSVVAYARSYLGVAQMHLQMAESDYAALTAAPSTANGALPVSAATGTAGLIATRSSTDLRWVFVIAAGSLALLAASVWAMVGRRPVTP